MKKYLAAIFFLMSLPAALSAQDQQVGARAKAMGGSYTAFEDDPVSTWLNPAGIATQSDGMALDYQTYTFYEPNLRGKASIGDADMGWNDPALIPSYLGVVFNLGTLKNGNQHAAGACFATPFHIKFTYKGVLPAELDQSFYRFRLAYAYDFRFKDSGTAGWFTHLSIGGGPDVSMTHLSYQEFGDLITSLPNRPPIGVNFTGIGFGGGLGLLLGLYDNTTNFKVNVGLAYQSQARYRFSFDPKAIPAFDWPNQINAGVTLYMLDDQPLRLTFDFQWIQWSRASSDPLLDISNGFSDAYNVSMGGEYRFKISDTVQLLPRAGLKYAGTPWGNANNLPNVGGVKLAIDTKGGHFIIESMGLGLAWSTESHKNREFDIAFEMGGDSLGFALGYSMEF